jgi:hypothetical protein
MQFNDFPDLGAKPILTEPGVKYFLHQTLKQCHTIRDNFHNMVFNIGLFIAFLLALGLILFYKYKGKLTPVEIEKKKQGKTTIYFIKNTEFPKS